MLQLNVWLRMRGTLIQDEYWSIKLYPRVLELLNLWQGPWVPDKRNINKALISHDFNGELIGNWRYIQSELETMDIGAYNMCMSWKESATDKELVIIENILNNLAHPIHMSDVI